MAFEPIPGSAYATISDPASPVLANEPWIIPEGFSQEIISDESDLNIYVGVDWPDMNVVNETKKHAGRYLYRTHEVRPGNDQRVDGTLGGAVSVVDLKTGVTKEVAARADWEALDGLLWTPWHTLLFAEETITAQRGDPDVPQATSGLVYEMKLDKRDPMKMESVAVRPLLGSLSHEGIETDAEGNVYVIDEDRKGSIYKFVPENYGDLSSGQLYALKVENGAKTGNASWIALDMNQVQISARVAAQAVGATSFCRPEDLERIGQTMYAALTCEDVTNPANINGAGAVLSISLDDTPVVNYFVAHGVNVGYENKTTGVSGLKSPDNLANGPDGKLWIVEDNVPSDIWVAEPDRDGDGYSDGVSLFASLQDSGAEGTGIYFGKDPHALFVNVQHSVTGNDKTMVITKDYNRRKDHGHNH
jgi:secreted PhoX family phosphatase